MATMLPDLPSPHLLIPLPDLVVDRPAHWRPVEVVVIERSTPAHCLLCQGRLEVDISPAGLHGASLRIPCPHCQQHVPLLLRYLSPGVPDEGNDHALRG